MLFLFAVVLVSIAFMTSLFIGRTSPTTSDELNELDRNPSTSNYQEENDLHKKLTISVTMDENEFKELMSQSDLFEINNEELTIEFIRIEDQGAYEYYKRASQLGEAPDIMLLDNTWINELAALGYLAEVDEIFMSNIQTLQLSPMIKQAKWNGFLWAVPKEVDPYVIVWNKERLVEFEYEKIPDNINDLILLNQKLKSLSENREQRKGIYIDFHDPYALISLFLAFDEEWFNDIESKFNFSNADLLQKFKDFFYLNEMESENQSNKISTDFPLASEFDPWEKLNTGEIAIMITRLSEFNKYALEHIELTAFPLDRDTNTKPGGWLHGKSFAVSSKSTIKKEAFEWIQRLTTTEIQIELMKAGGGLPVMLSAYSEQNRLQLMTTLIDEINDSIEQGSVFSPQPMMSNLIFELQNKMNQLWLDEISIEQFLFQLEESWNELLHI